MSNLNLTFNTDIEFKTLVVDKQSYTSRDMYEDSNNISPSFEKAEQCNQPQMFGVMNTANITSAMSDITLQSEFYYNSKQHTKVANTPNVEMMEMFSKGPATLDFI